MASDALKPTLSTVSRRAFLTTTAATTAALAWAGPAVLAAKRSKVRDIFVGKRGTTIWLDLDTAPYPDGTATSSWFDPTTIVFVPHYYRVRKDYRVDTIVHFHGYRDTADDAMKRHQLREQLYDSKQNAIIVFPQGPVRAESPNGGKLDKPDGLLRFLSELRKTLQTPRLQAKLGAAGIPNRARIGKLILSAHSGGFRVVSKCLQHGGYNVNEVYLFDALYGRAPVFAEWVAKTYRKKGPDETRHKLINYYADEPTTVESQRLMGMLSKKGVKYVHEFSEGQLSRREITKSRAVFIRTSVSHQGVLFRNNALRDCLFASSLKRYVKSGWFKNSGDSRDLERRKPE
jgi:hypothetical protein